MGDGLLLLALLIGGMAVPALLFRFFLRRYGGMATLDEISRTQVEFVKRDHDFRDRRDHPTEEEISEKRKATINA